MENNKRGKWEENMKCSLQKVMEKGITIREAVSHVTVPESILGDIVKKLKLGNSITTVQIWQRKWNHKRELSTLTECIMFGSK